MAPLPLGLPGKPLRKRPNPNSLVFLLKKEEIWTHLRCTHTGQRPCEGTEGGHLKAEEAASEETKPADTLILDFQPLEL